MDILLPIILVILIVLGKLGLIYVLAELMNKKE